MAGDDGTGTTAQGPAAQGMAAQGLAAAMHAKLEQAFRPQHLEVIDESEQHRGHGGWREGGETHFRVVMRAASLGPMGRVERSRAVHRVLEAELSGRVHALALDLRGPDV